MVPTNGKDSEGGHEKKSLRSPILLSGIIVVAALSAYVFYGFNGDSFDLSDRKALLIITDSMDGDVTEYKVDSFPEHTMVMVKGLSDSEKQDIQVGDVLSFRLIKSLKPLKISSFSSNNLKLLYICFSYL